MKPLLNTALADDSEMRLSGIKSTRPSQILIPGELKCNPSADTASKAWIDLRRYAREVFAAQDTHRFVLGFMWRSSTTAAEFHRAKVALRSTLHYAVHRPFPALILVSLSN
jgi:hypothetical protein